MNKAALVRMFEAIRNGSSSQLEASTSNWVRGFLVDVCRWPIESFQAQETIQPRGPVDWILNVRGQPAVYVEVKAWGRELRKEMISKYLDPSKSPLVFGVLTDAQYWELYVGGLQLRDLGVRTALLKRLRFKPDSFDLEDTLHFNGLWQQLRRMHLESEDVVRSVTRSSETVKQEIVSAHRDLFHGRSAAADLAQMLKLYPDKVTRSSEVRIPTDWSSWLLAIRTTDVAQAIRDECVNRFGVRKNAPPKLALSTLRNAFPLPGESEWSDLGSYF